MVHYKDIKYRKDGRLRITCVCVLEKNKFYQKIEEA